MFRYFIFSMFVCTCFFIYIFNITYCFVCRESLDWVAFVPYRLFLECFIFLKQM